MSGSYLLDTNIFIYAINQKLMLPAEPYATSVISKLELLSFPSLSEVEASKLKAILSRIDVVQLEESIQDKAVEIRRMTSLKLPDSIISATALTNDRTLVTNDDKLRARHSGKAMTLDELLIAH